ncbi:TAXI family TRAP transporter solute-binding subunit, partial [Candidatus Omnitrophota bacterium]
LGTTSASSAYYANEVGVAQIVNKYVPDIRITVVETGSAHNNIAKMQDGYIDFAGAMALVTNVRAYHGLDKPRYKDNPPKFLRGFIAELTGGTYTFVRVDSGVNKLEDLSGEEFAFGNPGSSVNFIGRTLFDAWGIKAEPFAGGHGDALAALKDGRIAGMLADITIGIAGIPPEIQEVHFLTPLKVVPLTEEQLDVAMKAYVGLQKVTRPAGELPGVTGPVTTYGATYTKMASSKTSEDVVYKMAKAMYEHYDEYLTIAPMCPSNYDPIKELVSSLDSMPEPLPLHAGVVKYCKEIGITVTEKLIPPEYKG